MFAAVAACAIVWIMKRIETFIGVGYVLFRLISMSNLLILLKMRNFDAWPTGKSVYDSPILVLTFK
jgi:hypothetical protein